MNKTYITNIIINNLIVRFMFLTHKVPYNREGSGERGGAREGEGEEEELKCAKILNNNRKYSKIKNK